MRIAFYALHYGKEYLAASVRSIQDAVDEIHVLYTPVPSFGHGRGEACPDTEEQLHAEAHRFLTKPLHWHRGKWRDEGHHRDAVYPIIAQRGATTMLVVDADEIWAPSAAKTALEAVEKANSHRRWSAHFCNFWRSFDWVVHDHFRSIRVVDLRHPQSPEDGHLSIEQQPEPVYHFGYAQSVALMRYKWTCHGHQEELRADWWQKFSSWTPGCDLIDLHPCVNNLWDRAHRTPDESLLTLKTVMGDHPNFGKELIE